MQRDKVTHFGGVPAMFFSLVNSSERTNYDTSSLKYAVSGAAPIPVQILTVFNHQFGVEILEGYGLSETSPTVTFNLPGKSKPGSVGEPIWGVEAKLLDKSGQEVPQGEMGEIVVRGPNVMKGYYNRPEETAQVMQGGWFHTGDIAYKDENGYFFIVDRIKDLIIRGGYNVYPHEIEEVLYQHEAVFEAAVIGIPHPKLGEEIKAFVTLKSNLPTTAEELIEFTKSRVANYKYPRMIEFLNELPKNSTGKILKIELRRSDDVNQN
jgi:long-chain acyl-CoA synthetase